MLCYTSLHSRGRLCYTLRTRYQVLEALAKSGGNGLFSVKRIARKIQDHLPKRRRRMWKYVSPKRRRIGLFVLALLLTLLYAGWYFTNDAFIRREAIKALEELTSGDVEIKAAEFSLFEGIRLYGVEVRLRGDESSRPFFSAEKVVLKHNPVALFLRRRIEAVEIYCVGPVVNIEFDKRAGISNAERLFRQASKAQSEGTSQPLPLPKIYLIQGKLYSVVKDGPRYERLFKKPVNWKCSLIPISPTVFQVTVERKFGDGDLAAATQPGDSANILWARLELDTLTGRIRTLEGAASHRLFHLLPPKYQKWIDRYQPRGEFRAIEGANTKPDEGRYEIQLRDFSLKLPPEEGGLTLADVQGTLLFSRGGVRMKDISGKVIEAGQAAFMLNGTYQGYDKASPFNLEVGIENLRLPEKATGTLEWLVSFLRRRFKPHGLASVSLHYQRDKAGRQSGEGVVTLNGISVQAEFFPLPMTNVCGKMFFTPKGIKSIDLTAEHGGSQFKIRGSFTKIEGYQRYDVTIDGRYVELDSALRKALPDRYKRIWDMLNPSGWTHGRYRIIDPGEHVKNIYELDMDMENHVEARCRWFPYPLRNIHGKIKLRGNTVTIPWLRSQSGDAVCKIHGQLDKVNTKKPDVQLVITALRVPLDAALRESFKGQARKLIESLNLSGLASRVEATISRSGNDEKLNFDVKADVKDVAYKYEKFPYAVTEAVGRLRITPQSVIVEELQGLHGEAEIRVDGKVILGEKTPRLDLTCSGKNVAMDEEFARSLPKNLREVWQSLTPSGLADMSVDLKTEGKAPDSKLTYHLTIDARGMKIRYREFPYAFHGVTGRVEAWPGCVVLRNMRAKHGEMTATISGDIRSGPKGDDVTMKISASEIPFDEEFLAAIPSDIVPLAKQFKPGGRCNAEITALTFHRDPLARTVPSAKGKAGKKTSRAISWSIEGGLGFRDVSLDIGFGPRKLTGTIDGKATQASGEGLGIAAEVELQSLELRRHKITDIRGRLRKAPKSNVLRLDKIIARMHEGRLAGDATIRLGEPLSYRLNASVENVNLSELFNAGKPMGQRQTQVNGRLTGQLILEATAGEHPTRQAVGELEISRGRMYKMPVILGLLNVIYLSVPGDSAFNSGFIRYHLKNDLLLLQEIYLTGDPEHGVSKGISVLGSGTLNMKTDAMNLTFLTGPPGKLPRLDNIVMELLRALSKELVEIRVTGTLKKPKMTTHHLRSLETILKRIIAPSLKTE